MSENTSTENTSIELDDIANPTEELIISDSNPEAATNDSASEQAAPQDQITFEQAQKLICDYFNNALWLFQFPELKERFDEHLNTCIANNPQYSEVLVSLVQYLASKTGYELSKAAVVEDAPAMTAQFKCSSGSCSNEMVVSECESTEDCDVASGCTPTPTPTP